MRIDGMTRWVELLDTKRIWKKCCDYPYDNVIMHQYQCRCNMSWLKDIYKFSVSGTKKVSPCYRSNFYLLILKFTLREHSKTMWTYWFCQKMILIWNFRAVSSKLHSRNQVFREKMKPGCFRKTMSDFVEEVHCLPCSFTKLIKFLFGPYFGAFWMRLLAHFHMNVLPDCNPICLLVCEVHRPVHTAFSQC